MIRLFNFVLLLAIAFALGAFAGVHCPVVNQYAGGTGAVTFKAATKCDCPAGDCDCCPGCPGHKQK